VAKLHHDACDTYFHLATPPVCTQLPQAAMLDARKSLPAATNWLSARPKSFTQPVPRSTASCGTNAQQGNSDTTTGGSDKIKRVVCVSGKVYYDLLEEERTRRGIDESTLLAF